MIYRNGRLAVGKIHFAIGFEPDYSTQDRGWRRFELSLFRLISKPPEGAAINRSNYKGFRLQFFVFFPITLKGY